MSQSIFPGPIAPQNNPPIEPQYYAPNRFVITAIELGRSTTVTTAITDFGATNNFVVGQLVRFIIPSSYGTIQLNEQMGYVTSISMNNQIIVGIDTSSNYTPFRTPTFPVSISPQLLPVGDINTGTINSSGRTNNGTFIPGSFINISPN